MHPPTRGPGVVLMKNVVDKPTNEEYVAIAAYISALK
jgi:hypothetical protein